MASARDGHGGDKRSLEGVRKMPKCPRVAATRWMRPTGLAAWRHPGVLEGGYTDRDRSAGGRDALRTATGGWPKWAWNAREKDGRLS